MESDEFIESKNEPSYADGLVKVNSSIWLAERSDFYIQRRIFFKALRCYPDGIDCVFGSRAEAVFQQCQRGMPTPSDAEKAVARQLKELGDLSALRSRLDALAAKFEYQKKQMSEHIMKQPRDTVLAALSASQRGVLHMELAAQGDQIAALVTAVQAVRKRLAL